MMVEGKKEISDNSTKKDYARLFWEFKSLILSNVWEKDPIQFIVQYRRFLDDYNNVVKENFAIGEDDIIDILKNAEYYAVHEDLDPSIHHFVTQE